MLSALSASAARAPSQFASRSIATKCWKSSPLVSVPSRLSCPQDHQQPQQIHPASPMRMTPLPSGIIRPYSTTTPRLSLDEFRDPVPRLQRLKEPVGREWTVKELRRKSFDDLHKLWYVLYKEKNMLLTEKHLSNANSLKFPQPHRWTKVKKSMKAIRVVLGERKRERKVDKAAAKALAEAEQYDSEDEKTAKMRRQRRN